MEDESHDEAKLDGESIVGLDAYSRDGQFIGRVTSYLPTAPESEAELEEGHIDPTGPDGHLIGPKHLLIDGTGTIVQSTLVVTESALDVDLRGRRVTVPLSISEIEAMPQHDPNWRHEDD